MPRWPQGLHVSSNLAEQFGQHGRITNAATGDLDGPNFERLLVDADVDLAPETALRATMFAGVPLAFTFGLDASAVDQEVQRALGATVSNWSEIPGPPLMIPLITLAHYDAVGRCIHAIN